MTHVELPKNMSDVLQQLIDRAAIELHAAAGGSALCRITASGSPGSRVKRAEGQWAALQALARCMRPDDQDAFSHAQRLILEWQGDLDRWSTHPGSSWVPYCEGGLEGLRRFAEVCGNDE